MAYGVGAAAIAATTLLFFSFNAWVPVVTPLAGFTLASGGLLLYRRSRSRSGGRLR